MARNSTHAKLEPPAAYQGIPLRLGRSNAAVVAAVVATVSIDVLAVAPLIATEAGESAQVAGSFAAAGAMAQVRATAPVKPPDGVTLIVEELPVVAPGITVMFPLLVRAKVGATYAVTFTLTMVI